MYDQTFEQAIKNSEHLKALGQTTIYLRDCEYPWKLADSVEAAGSKRSVRAGCHWQTK